jgi:gliding motility-associated-like protein
MTKPMNKRFSILAGLLLAGASCPAFELPKEAVYPRIFSPNGDGINDVVNFDVANPSLDTVEGKIYDRGGSLVADIRFDSFPAVGVDRWVWDGRDRNGNLARAGIYIYEVSSGGRSVTGTVVVAK